MKTFGLLGKSLAHSFSSQYFSEKFFKEGISDAVYNNFELDDITEFPRLITKNNFSGLNVTIPYKESIIPFLDELTDRKTIGHNSDWLGFSKSIISILEGRKTALVLGNGGAAKAVKFALNKLNIEHKTVSRGSLFDYHNLTEKIIEKTEIVINTTPIGMHPKTELFPQIPYNALNTKHLLFDLVYNPEETKFLKYGKAKGAEILNGKKMLYLQAEESWKIWN